MTRPATSQDDGRSELHDYVQQSETIIQQEYERIRKRSLEDPGTAGDQGEENWASFLRSWLPRAYPVVTKGRILSEDGYASPQVDVLVLSPSYPPALIDKKLYLSAGVLAAFECKTTFRRHHIEKAVTTAVDIRRHLSQNRDTPHRTLCSPLIFGLLAHSHEWTSAKDEVIETITQNLIDADRANVVHPRECLDCLVVADLGAWVTVKLVESGFHHYYGNDPTRTDEPRKLMVNVAPFCFSPYYNGQYGDCRLALGAFLQELFRMLAWDDLAIRRLAGFMKVIRLGGSGSCGTVARIRHYDSKIFTGYVEGALLKMLEERHEMWRRSGGPGMVSACNDFDEWYGTVH